MALIRHIPFLKAVAQYACTAFGGPNAHIGVMTKTFVEKRRDVTQEELLELFSFCQILPGPSSTQTVTLIGYKRGGIPLAILTLIVWALPAVIIMGALSFVVKNYHLQSTHKHLFYFIQPMAIGFLLYATWQSMKMSIKNYATFGIMMGAILFSCLINSPWVFPILMIVGSVISNISSKRIPEKITKPKKITWINLGLFIILFILAGTLSELSRVYHWQHARLFNLFENFYRFGSLVWGGGHALMSVMAEQFITLQTKRGLIPYLNFQDYLTGFGLINCVPGPVFSVSSYIGGMATSSQGIAYQLAGIVIASVGVFLPSLLLVLFLFPIYNNLKQHVKIFRALEGIHAVVVGIMWASGIKLIANTFPTVNIQEAVIYIAVVLVSFCVLKFTKVPAPILVLACLVLGWIW